MRILLLISILLPFYSVANAPDFDKSIKQWQFERLQYLKKPEGWLSVTGLFWLTDGVNGIGSEIDNKITLPRNKAPEYLGSFILNKGKITANFPPNSQVFEGDNAVVKMVIETDHKQEPTVLKHNTLIWSVLEREGRFGVRVKDLSLPSQKSLDKLTYFATDPNWQVTATFTAYSTPKTLSVPTVMPWFWKATSPGTVSFNIEGKTHQLDIIDSGDEFFIIFGDTTNGKQTYGAGRFLYVDKPTIDDEVIIDFNKAHNPPCVFTPYATCPLPPPQNKLALSVEAGEKNFHF